MQTITVFGATGVQGGSVIKGILNHPEVSKKYKVRAITRDSTKGSAQKLAAKGVELAKADLDHLDSIQDAIKGSDAVFAVTNYWEKQSKELEITQGKAIADACKATGVKHLVWSALPHVTKLTNGALRGVEHFDSKAEVAEYIETMKEDMIATYFMPGFYMQNIKGMINPAQDGTPTLMQPWDGDKTKVALFDAATDTGTFVAGILSQDPKSVDGIYVQGCSQWITPNEMVFTLSDEIGKKVAFQQVPEEEFKKALPEAVAEEMTENMVLVRDYSYFGLGKEKDQDVHDKILSGVKKVTWREFVKANGPWEWAASDSSLYNHL